MPWARIGFCAATVGEGADAARARFGRYARAVRGRWPRVEEIARAHPPVHRVWFRAADVVCESDPGALEAQLNAIIQLGSLTEPEMVEILRALDIEELPEELGDYVRDILEG